MVNNMDITDINEFLSLSDRIRLKGSNWFSMSTTAIKNVKKKAILKLDKYITESRKEAFAKERLERLEKKIADGKALLEKMINDDEFFTEENLDFLIAFEDKIKKLETKKAKMQNKGLGIFALSKLAVQKMRMNFKENRRKRKQVRQIKQEVNSIYENQKRIEELQKEIEKYNNNISERIKKNPDLVNKINDNVEITKIHTEVTSDNDKEVTDIVTKVTEIRIPSKEEKEVIKKSSRFKKALAAIALITGIAIGLSGSFNSKNVNNITPDDVLVDVPPPIETSINENQEVKLGSYVNIDNGSIIYEKPNLDGNSGLIGTNGYDSNTLFKVNAITYVDENNNEITFNTVQQDDQNKNKIEEEHKKYLENNPNLEVKNFHITPCDELGNPMSDNELGGWTNSYNAKIKKVDMQKVLVNSNNSLEGKVL